MTEAVAPKRRGRRPSGEDTRGAILVAARTEFAARGYDGTTLRGIARAAGVDARLVHHYYDGGKEEIFVAAAFRLCSTVRSRGGAIRTLTRDGTSPAPPYSLTGAERCRWWSAAAPRGGAGRTPGTRRARPRARRACGTCGC